MKENVKEKLRRDILKKRKAMKKEDVAQYSKDIISRLVSLQTFKESNNIMIYLSFNNEVDTYKLMDICLKQGKKVLVPFCIKQNKKMIPSEVKDPQKELVMNSIGYKEPHMDYLREMRIDDIDLIIVPGVVFDYFGNRIGFGGGYYDRFLNNVTKAKTIALCYDYQLVDRIPADKFGRNSIYQLIIIT